MERDIKPTYDELESYVENLQKQLADAQATVAALQARVKELCKFRQADHEQLVEVQKYWRESQDEVHELQSQLTQRTAELEAANKLIYKKNCDLGRAETINNDLQAELERVRGELAETKEVEVALSLKVAEYEVELNGDPQNFYGRGRTVGLRALMAALPKVEGEIYEAVASYRYDKAPEAWFHCESQLIALLQHRQGMEG